MTDFSFSLRWGYGSFYTYLDLQGFIFGVGNRKIIRSFLPISTVFPVVYENVIYSFDYSYKQNNESSRRKACCFWKIFIVNFQSLTLFNRRNLASVCFIYCFCVRGRFHRNWNLHLWYWQKTALNRQICSLNNKDFSLFKHSFKASGGSKFLYFVLRDVIF